MGELEARDSALLVAGSRVVLKLTTRSNAVASQGGWACVALEVFTIECIYDGNEGASLGDVWRTCDESLSSVCIVWLLFRCAFVQGGSVAHS